MILICILDKDNHMVAQHPKPHILVFNLILTRKVAKCIFPSKPKMSHKPKWWFDLTVNTSAMLSINIKQPQTWEIITLGDEIVRIWSWHLDYI